MYRTHTCGALRADHIGKTVTLCGWIQRSRNLGGMTFVDLRDRYGITQLAFSDETDAELLAAAHRVQREFVVQVTGEVIRRASRNPNMPTGDIEIKVTGLSILNTSKTPPFTIETETDGGDELRMKYRYLDIRRTPVRNNLMLRHRMAMETRNYLDRQHFVEIETPCLIKSTPEGARDFVVPSRMNKGQFYALPQSPQTFKQLLMVAGMDRYYQIVKCFRDEDLRADRQPEFTQIDCEMAFVEQEDVLNTFEGLIRHLFRAVLNVDIMEIPRMSYDEAIRRYGSDKPDIRFGMEFAELNDLAKGKGFGIFDSQELVVGIAAPDCAKYSRREIDALTDWVKRPQIGMKGLVHVKCNTDGSYGSSVSKFFSQEELAQWAGRISAREGDLILILAGDADKTRRALNELRLEMARRLGLRRPDEFQPLWVTDFPLLGRDEETGAYHPIHHPFTSPKPEDMELLGSDPGAVRANAYDLTLNGNEIGGGSIRIHDRDLQKRMFNLLGFSEEEAQKQFGFLMDAFEYGAPPHGGIAIGFDRLVALFGGSESIRDFIAFPKNNAGRDVMIDAPATLNKEQLVELHLNIAAD